MSDEKKPISMIEGVGDRDERGLKCRDCGVGISMSSEIRALRRIR